MHNFPGGFTMGRMRDLASTKTMWLKAGSFLAIAVVASVLLLVEHPTLKVAALLALAVWGWCRAYYFAFYVIEHYIDPGYRFAGLWSFVAYALRKRGPKV